MTKFTCRHSRSKFSQMLHFISFHVKINFSRHCSKVGLSLIAVNSYFDKKRSNYLIRMISSSCCRQYNSFQFDSLRALIGFKMSKILQKQKKCLLIIFVDVTIMKADEGPIMVQISLVSAGSNPDVDNFTHFFPRSLYTKILSMLI